MKPGLLRLGLRLYLRNAWKIFFFSSCIAAGVAFLFSAGNILEAVDRSIAERARELLAADVKIHSNRPISGRTRKVLARFEKDGVRLTKVAAVDLPDFESLQVKPCARSIEDESP